MADGPARVVVRPADLTGSADVAATLDLGRRYYTRWGRSPAGWLDEAFVAEVVNRPGVVPERDLLLVDADGRPAASMGVFGIAPYSELVLSVFTDPDLPADQVLPVGRAVVTAATAAARARLAQEGLLDGGAAASLLVALAFPGEPFVEVLQREGFRHLRSTLAMQRPLDGPVVPAPLPEGVSVRPVDPATDCDELAAVMTAFADHPGDWVLDAEALRFVLSLPSARPDLGLLAHDADGPVGALLVQVDDDGAGIEAVATLPRLRGRGLATALLTRAFETVRLDGSTVVRLHVDATNPTGAVGVYERAGMVREDEVQSWSRPALL